MFRNFLNKNKSNKSVFFLSGFGLIEMMVSIGILVLVMTVILARQDAFNSAVLLRGQAYEVALQAREIQLYAVSVIGSGSSFRVPYGIHFINNSGSYTIFRDINNNGVYDGSDTIFGKQGILDPRFVIDRLQVDGGASLSELSIVFERPNFDALFGGDVAEIDVRLRGTTGTGVGEVRTVEITRTGQISVQ
ncbi:MAG: hypothetical protein R3B60_02395 [Candidatus Paceibacterota bacterium]